MPPGTTTEGYRTQPSWPMVVATIGITAAACAGAVLFDRLAVWLLPASQAWARGWAAVGAALVLGLPVGWVFRYCANDAPLALLFHYLGLIAFLVLLGSGPVLSLGSWDQLDRFLPLIAVGMTMVSTRIPRSSRKKAHAVVDSVFASASVAVLVWHPHAPLASLAFTSYVALVNALAAYFALALPDGPDFAPDERF